MKSLELPYVYGPNYGWFTRPSNTPIPVVVEAAHPFVGKAYRPTAFRWMWGRSTLPAWSVGVQRESIAHLRNLGKQIFERKRTKPYLIVWTEANNICYWGRDPQGRGPHTFTEVGVEMSQLINAFSNGLAPEWGVSHLSETSNNVFGFPLIGLNAAL